MEHSYKIMKRRAPGWKWFMHDSFRLSTGLWNGFMRGCPDVVMDTHIYQAWNWCAHVRVGSQARLGRARVRSALGWRAARTAHARGLGRAGAQAQR